MKIFIILFAVVALTGCRQCIQWEKQEVHHEAWTQFIPSVNNTLIPIFHPAYDAQKNVCIQWEEDK